jgi:hypothetical protein
MIGDSGFADRSSTLGAFAFEIDAQTIAAWAHK